MFYAYTEQTSDEMKRAQLKALENNERGLDSANRIQNTETLEEICVMLADDSITSALFETYTGDYAPLFVGFNQPSYENDVWYKVESYLSPEDFLADVLPSGSGINYDWSIEKRGNTFVCSNKFETMCEGQYTDVTPFSVYLYHSNRVFTVRKVTLGTRFVECYDEDGVRYNGVSDLREYLNDTFENIQY